MCLLAGVVYAQDPPICRANTDVVVVPVTVIDRSVRFVRGLTAEQFEISERAGSTFEAAHADGKFHPISIKLKDARHRVRARAGYLAGPPSNP